ncbi:MAG: hypothetical protein WA919_29595 [Coleofasciculaceae cyanobacterium]
MLESRAFEDYQQRITDIVHSLEEENQEDIENITRILSRITHLPFEQIKPRLHSLVKKLVELQEVPFYAKATPQEWTEAFSVWVESHRGLALPSLSDEAISRESIYGDER